MERRNPNPFLEPSIRTLLAVLCMVAVAVASAGREPRVTLDPGFSWAAPAGSCSGRGPLADVAANAAPNASGCATIVRAATRGGGTTPGLGQLERLMRLER